MRVVMCLVGMAWAVLGCQSQEMPELPASSQALPALELRQAGLEARIEQLEQVQAERRRTLSAERVTLAVLQGQVERQQKARAERQRRLNTRKTRRSKDVVAEGVGFLTVNASPTAQVYLDGKLVASKTPLAKHELDAGSHTVRVFFIEDKKFSETKRATITDGRHVNLYFQKR